MIPRQTETCCNVSVCPPGETGSTHSLVAAPFSHRSHTGRAGGDDRDLLDQVDQAVRTLVRPSPLEGIAMSDEAIRPEVVDAILAALTKMDPAELAPLEVLGATPAETSAAHSLFASTLIAGQNSRKRWLEAMDVLISTGVDFGTQPSWSDLYDALPESDVNRLRELYDVLPDGAREEFDLRYGRPQL
jgi:hypothetical protein